MGVVVVHWVLRGEREDESFSSSSSSSSSTKLKDPSLFSSFGRSKNSSMEKSLPSKPVTHQKSSENACRLVDFMDNFHKKNSTLTLWPPCTPFIRRNNLRTSKKSDASLFHSRCFR